jgi:hypothetical protein
MTSEPSAADYAMTLEAMTDDEVFEAMRAAEAESEAAADALSDALADRLRLVEDEIGRRFPGQLLAPYLDWKKKRLLP